MIVGYNFELQFCRIFGCGFVGIVACGSGLKRTVTSADGLSGGPGCGMLVWD